MSQTAALAVLDQITRDARLREPADHKAFSGGMTGLARFARNIGYAVSPDDIRVAYLKRRRLASVMRAVRST